MSKKSEQIALHADQYRVASRARGEAVTANQARQYGRKVERVARKLEPGQEKAIEVVIRHRSGTRTYVEGELRRNK